ncbi:MAG: imidazolonepropionase [Planctomycetes bacterium]|nr:imidazolonepropionase [Planctomycetota bacterium]
MHIDSDKLVIENLKRVVTCAPDNSGPLLRENMRALNVLNDDPVVAVKDGRVAWIGEFDRLPAVFDTAERIDGKGLVLTPGLVDCHTHPAFVRGRADEFAMRLAGATYEQIAAAGGGIVSSTKGVREATDEKLVAETTRNLQRLRRHGVVAVEGKSGYGLSLEHELRQLRAIGTAGEAVDMHTVRTCLAAHSLPMEYRGSDKKRAEYLKLVTDEILPAVVKEGLAERADIFHDKGAFNVREVVEFAKKVKALGLRLTVHADQLHEDGGGEIAAAHHADSADHLEFLDPAGIDVMIKNGTCAVLLPGSTYVLKMQQWADGRWMIDAGLTVALATDFNPGSSPVANPAFVMNLAVMHCGLTPEEALAAFTVNAAQALRLSTDEWGVIKPGSRAAFALWDVDHEREIPYYAGTNSCIEVITCRAWRS